MRQSITSFFLCVLPVGCSRTDEPPEKYFSGKPVEHWLEAMKSPDPKTRKKAADVLGNVGPIDPRAVPALTEAVRDRDVKVRDAAVLGLSKIGPPASSAEAVLEEATRDSDPLVRTHATAALGRVRGVQ